MSGIFGIIHRDGRPVEVADLERMRVAMAHRGPDGSAIWRAGEAGLGQLMLHSTPESLHETLPWQDPESGLVITADARIDNRDELAATLGLSVRRPQSGPLQGAVGGHFAGDASSVIPDSQFILEAYKRWGEACVDHLLGDFAFAIWNPRDRQLFCARDHMGIRPFYYYLNKGLFVFASSALGVVSVAAVPNRISEMRIADYLVQELEGVDKTCSWFEDVWRLPPAHVAVLSIGALGLRKYWQPDPESELILASDEDYTDAFEEVLTDAIRARIRSHRPVASMLSGGLDSSVIVGIARKLQLEATGRPFVTFSGVAEDGQDCRESHYSRMVIGQGGLDTTLLRPSDVCRFEDRLKQIDRISEDPFDMNWTHHEMIYLSAHEQGIVGVMDGIDGDGVASLTSTYPAYLFKSGKWLTAHREVLAKWENYHRRSIPLASNYMEMIRLGLVPDFVRKWKRKQSPSEAENTIERCIIDPAFATSMGMVQRLAGFRIRVGLGTCPSLRAAHIRRIDAPYLTAGIERYGRLASICGVEQRQPILDRRVVDFCVALPWRQLVRDGFSKFQLRKLAQREVGHELAWRTGWDSLLWKFWHARDQASRNGKQVILEQLSGAIESRLNVSRFNSIRSEYMMGEIEAADVICCVAHLNDWLKLAVTRGK